MPHEVSPRVKNIFRGLGLALVYFLAAKWGLSLAFVQANATAVWPPTGIALAALLLGGWRIWPGIFLGAFIANLLTAGNILTSFGIATGNSLEALLGFFLVSRLAGGANALERSSDLFKFAVLGGLAAPLVSATFGVMTLDLAGMVETAQLKDVWFTWWLGDVGGALLVAPPILLWPRHFPWTGGGLRMIEGAGLAVLLFFMAWLLFGGWSILSVGNAPVHFLLIPLLLWAAIRFGPFTTSLVVLFISLFAIHGTLQGFGPFHGLSENQSLLFLQSFMSVTAVTFLALSRGSAERKRAEEELRWSHANLQLKVLERTEDLSLANRELGKKIKEKDVLAQGLMESNEKFHLLAEATQEGVVLVFDGKIKGANSAFCRIFGYEPKEVIGMRSEQFVVPECRDTVRRNIQSKFEKSYTVTGLRKDGSRIDLEITGKTIHADGERARVTAIRDVTERNRKEEELRRLAMLVETSTDFICLAGLDGHMIYVNGDGRRLTGLGPQEDVTTKLHQDFIAPEDVPRLMEEVIAALLSEGRWQGEFQLRHFKTGDPLPFHFTAVLIRDPATGEPRVMAAIGRDLREMRKKEEELRRLGLLVENVQDYAIFFLDMEGRVESWNAGARRITGYEASEIIGKHFSSFYTPEDIQSGKPESLLTEASRRGRVEDEGWRVRKDGSRFWADTILTALRDQKGDLKGFAKITRDATHRKKAEELTRSNRELEQFAYVASHDLQEPLRMVTSFVQLLAHKYEGKLDPEAHQYIHEVVDGAGRMRALILDLLAYSRVESAGEPFEVLDCSKALHQALLNLETTLKECGAEVFQQDLPEVRGDFNQVVQLFQNLVGNAVKFRGTLPPKIKVEAKKKGKEWVLCVRDNGIGMDPKYSEQIFEIFKRLHTRSEYPGTGIGLAICKKVVGRHGGRIWVESQEGKGAAFYWTFPILQEEDHDPGSGDQKS